MGLGGTLVPLRQRPFRLLWLGRVASAAGDALVPVALAFAVLAVGHSTIALGGVLAAFMGSRVVFTLVGGVIADRLPRRAVMLACDLVRAVVEAFTAAMLLTGHMTLPLFFVTAAFFGAASAFFGPASDGLVPQTIRPEDLQPANALLNISRNALNVFGPAVSGALIALAGTGWVFAIDAASFVASAFFLVQLKVPEHARAERSRFLAEVREGFREVSSRAWVRAPIVGFALSNFCLAAMIVLGPPIFRDHFHGARDWGIVSAAGAVGAILGSLASVRLRPRRPISACFAAFMLIALPLAALAGPLPAAAIALAWAIGTGSVALGNTWWETTLQRDIPPAVYARVRSYDLLVSFIFMPLGMVVFPLIARSLGYGWTLLGAAVACAVTNLVVALVPGVQQVSEPTMIARAEPEPARV
ncbi:MAG: MFS transporter [Gaiellaceae bacterium]